MPKNEARVLVYVRNNPRDLKPVRGGQARIPERQALVVTATDGLTRFSVTKGLRNGQEYVEVTWARAAPVE